MYSTNILRKIIMFRLQQRLLFYLLFFLLCSNATDGVASSSSSVNYSVSVQVSCSGSFTVSTNYDNYMSTAIIAKPVVLNSSDYELSVWFKDLVNINSDADRMPDWWELFYHTDPQIFDQHLDPDNDSLDNLTEYLFLSDPQSQDTDADLMPDDWEYYAGTNPVLDDSYMDYDDDLLLNIAEFVYRTDPFNPDTDADGQSDSDEILHGSDPTVTDRTFEQPVSGSLNYSMQAHSSYSFNISVSVNYDMLQSLETMQMLTPLNRIYALLPWFSELFANTDTDRMPDWWELFYSTKLLIFDENEDPDNDSLLNITEYIIGTDPHNDDTDGDLLPDYWEFIYNTNPIFNDASDDYDADLLYNLAEYLFHTDPQNPDTDGDGASDSTEVLSASNPLVADVTYDIQRGSTNYSLQMETVNYAGTISSESTNYDVVDSTSIYSAQYNLQSDMYLIQSGFIAILITDSDGDGIPDSWELLTGTNPYQDDALLDPDNDALSNLEEYNYFTSPYDSDTDHDGQNDRFESIAGSDPLDPYSIFSCELFVNQSGIYFKWSFMPGRRYVLLVKDNLENNFRAVFEIAVPAEQIAGTYLYTDTGFDQNGDGDYFDLGDVFPPVSDEVKHRFYKIIIEK